MTPAAGRLAWPHEDEDDEIGNAQNHSWHWLCQRDILSRVTEQELTEEDISEPERADAVEASLRPFSHRAKRASGVNV